MNQIEQLTDKMSAEFNSFRDWLLTQPPEEILNHAYEYSAKQDIVLSVADADLSPVQIETLLRSHCPLEDVYHDCAHVDNTELNYALCQIIEQRAEIEIEKQRAVPVYNGKAQEAKERGELDKFKASAEADENCKTAIENAIARNYDGSRLNTKAAIAEVREQFGERRMARVTASLVDNAGFDWRISPDNKAWANKKAINKSIKNERVHLGLLDIFATRLREDLAKKRERGAER